MRDGNFLLILYHNGSRWFVIDSALLTNKLHSCFFFSQKTFYHSLLSGEFLRNLKFNTMLYHNCKLQVLWIFYLSCSLLHLIWSPHVGFKLPKEGKQNSNFYCEASEERTTKRLLVTNFLSMSCHLHFFVQIQCKLNLQTFNVHEFSGYLIDNFL